MTPYRGPFNSELVLVVGDREIADCVASTGVDLALAAGLRIPNTAAEREALRVDSGDTVGGMSLASLRAGLKKRYDLDSRLLSGQANVEAALDAGVAIAGFGRYDVLPVDWRWQKRGDFLHSMWFNRDTSVTRWRADPLAPPSNLGAAMPKTIVRTYLASGGWQALGVFEDSVTNPPNTGGDMLKISDPVPALIDLPKGAQLFDPSGRPLVKVSVPTVGQVSPYEVELGANAHYRLARATTGGVMQAVLIHVPDANVRPVPPPALPDCSAKVGAEHERTLKQAKDALEAIP